MPAKLCVAVPAERGCSRRTQSSKAQTDSLLHAEVSLSRMLSPYQFQELCSVADPDLCRQGPGDKTIPLIGTVKKAKL